jgi:hypothetical protein
MWDYDEVGTHILIDSEIAGQPRKLVTHSAPGAMGGREIMQRTHLNRQTKRDTTTRGDPSGAIG